MSQPNAVANPTCAKQPVEMRPMRDDIRSVHQESGDTPSLTPVDGEVEMTAPQPTRMVWNPLLGEYGAQAPGRMRRNEGTNACPFCADLTTGRVPPDTQAWIRPNDFPAFHPPTGECFVLIYSSNHDCAFTELSVADIVRVIGLWQQVYTDLASRYACVMTWETSGAATGQTQFHPHGQTYAVSIIPDMIQREMQLILQAEAKGRGCPFCELLHEEEAGPRIVFDGAHWLGYVPPFARYPYQAQLTSRTHLNAINGFPLDGEAAAELASALLYVIRAYNAVFEAPMPYMLAIHQLADERFHLHIDLLPLGRAPGKLKLAASSEMAWGFWLNDSLPEAKAAELRAAIAKERQ
ncbi:MAG: galactose-1-phosphate uridylyltransferase [Ktedonobacterales bacterium]